MLSTLIRVLHNLFNRYHIKPTYEEWQRMAEEEEAMKLYEEGLDN